VFISVTEGPAHQGLKRAFAGVLHTTLVDDTYELSEPEVDAAARGA